MSNDFRDDLLLYGSRHIPKRSTDKQRATLMVVFCLAEHRNRTVGLSTAMETGSRTLSSLRAYAK